MNAHPTISSPTPKSRPTGGLDLRPDPTRPETHSTSVGSDTPVSGRHVRPASQRSTAAADTTLDPGHSQSETERPSAGVDFLVDDQPTPETHCPNVVGDPSGSTDHAIDEAQCRAVGAATPPSRPPNAVAQPQTCADGWLELRIWAEMFDDAQKARIAATNRAERGGVDPIVYEAYLDRLRVAEHECGLAMRRCLRRVAPKPIIEWQKASNGIGEHLLARLLGHLAHPVWAEPHHWEGTGSSRVLVTDPPFERTVGQLWQYCGHGAPARKRKGMTAEDLAGMGNPTLKMVLHLHAEACMKTRSSPYRLVYEQARLAVADKAHTVECVRCGPSGKPAQEGSPWSPGHQLAHALRIVGKEILRDLWIVAGGGAREATTSTLHPPHLGDPPRGDDS